MTYTPKKQRGMTMTSIVLLLIIICGVILLVLKITPVYMTHGKVRSAIESMMTIPEIEKKSKSQIQRLLGKRFDINNIRNLPKDAVKIKKHGSYVKITAKYDVKVPLVGNLSALMEFDEFVEKGDK